MAFGARAVVSQPFDEVVQGVRDALAGQGLQVVTETDLSDVFGAQLGVDVPPQVLLGVCHADLARAVLEVEPSLGLLLPSHVVVRVHGESETVVEAADPSLMVALTGNPALEPVATGVRAQLEAAVLAVAGTA